MKGLKWERTWLIRETERSTWLVCRDTGKLVREDTLGQKRLVGKTRTPLSHFKEFKPNAKSRKIPWEGLREGLGK